jgi:hypothetical protein
MHPDISFEFQQWKTTSIERQLPKGSGVGQAFNASNVELENAGDFQTQAVGVLPVDHRIAWRAWMEISFHLLLAN